MSNYTARTGQSAKRARPPRAQPIASLLRADLAAIRLRRGGPRGAHRVSGEQMSSKTQEPVGLLRKFDEDCARLSAVRDTMLRSLSSQHLSALQRQAVAMGSLQRDLKILQADLEAVKEGLGEQLSSITAASKPHWKFVPVQRAATSTERDAALALQQRWRRRPRHTRSRQYSTTAVMQST